MDRLQLATSVRLYSRFYDLAMNGKLIFKNTLLFLSKASLNVPVSKFNALKSYKTTRRFVNNNNNNNNNEPVIAFSVQ